MIFLKNQATASQEERELFQNGQNSNGEKHYPILIVQEKQVNVWTWVNKWGIRHDTHWLRGAKFQLLHLLGHRWVGNRRSLDTLDSSAAESCKTKKLACAVTYIDEFQIAEEHRFITVITKESVSFWPCRKMVTEKCSPGRTFDW